MLDFFSHNSKRETMPDPSIGLGAGAGGGILALAWIADKVFGKSSAMATQVSEIYKWCNVPDPDDSTQRIWWLSRKIRECIESTFNYTRSTFDTLTRLTDAVESQDKTQRELVGVVKALHDDLSELRKWAQGGERK